MYSMQVLEITGSHNNPKFWQFFVAVIGFNIVIYVLLFASDYWAMAKNWTEMLSELENPRRHAQGTKGTGGLPQWSLAAA